MKYVAEYRDAAAVRALVEAIARDTTRPWRVMEVCGGQTHAIARFGLEELLPEGLELLHGPGCPVCVTPVELIDAAITVARRPEVTLCSYGDMLRVPGSRDDLFAAKAAGADVRVVYSVLDALAVARNEPERQVVFFAVGFETTAPGHALAVAQAERDGVANFSLLVSHVLVPPAIEAIAQSGDVDGFLAAGHVCTVAGVDAYRPLSERHQLPIVVTGFEPVDILQGLHLCVRQLEEGRAEVENPYARAVRAEGNPVAWQLVDRLFEVVDRQWRGIGGIPSSGLALRPEYAAFDALLRFGLDGAALPSVDEATRGCRAGEVLTGRLKPPECEAFGRACTPETPLGATMVSTEGACAAYFQYRRGA